MMFVSSRLKAVLLFALALVFTFTTAFSPAMQETELVPVNPAAKISPALYEAFGLSSVDRNTATPDTVLQAASDTAQTVSTMLWLEDDVNMDAAAVAGMRASAPTATRTILPEEPSMEEVQSYIEAKRAHAREQYAAQNKAYKDAYLADAKVHFVSQYSPVIIADLTLPQALSLAEKADVQALEYMPLEVEGDTSLAINPNALASYEYFADITLADYVRDYWGYDGTGVKIGVIERTLPLTEYLIEPITIRAEADAWSDALPSNSGLVANCVHPVTVCNIIQKIAPDSSIYFTALDCSDPITQEIYTYHNNIEWLLTQGVNIINISQVVGSDGWDTYGIASRWIDHIAFNHDVHVVMASGNLNTIGAGTDPTYNPNKKITSGAMSYNAITVGSWNVGTFSSPASSPSVSSFSGYFQGSSTSTLARKPDLCAPGETLYEANGLTGAGTSFAAPIVSGIMAQIGHAQPSLLTRQDAMKAILTASVNDAYARYAPHETGYRQNGSGLVDANTARWLARVGRYVGTSISSGTKSHTFTVTASDTSMRISLAYLNYIKYSYNIPHAGAEPPEGAINGLQMSIYAPNGAIVATTSQNSDSYNNNVKIIQFDPRPYGAGTYTIKIIRSGSMTASSVYYGIAWR